MTRWQIPGALPVDWKMRALDTASIAAGYLAVRRGRRQLTVLAQQGDFRNWAEIRDWATGIADTRLS